MKKKYFLPLIVLAVLLLGMVLPTFVSRVATEQEHKYFDIALHLSDTIKLYDTMQEHMLHNYLLAGVDIAVIQEENGQFDTELMALADQAGMQVALAVYGGSEKSADYANTLDALVKQYHIRHLLLRSDGGEYPLPIENVVKDNQLTVVVCENFSQLSNEHIFNYNEIVAAAHGRLVRCYETLADPMSKLGDGPADITVEELLFSQMMNSARDRNTEFILLNQINDGAGAYTNCSRTATAAKKFAQWMTSRGYDRGTTAADLSGYDLPPRHVSAAALALAVIMVWFTISTLYRSRWTSILFLAVTVGLFGLTFVLPEFLLLWYPTLYALVLPCFALSLIVFVTDGLRGSCGKVVLVLSVLGLALATLLIGAIPLCSMLSGQPWYLNDLVFHGVKLTLLAPMAFSAVYMFFYLGGRFTHLHPRKILSFVKNTLARLPLWLWITAGILAVALIGLYLLRSGNAQISSLELTLRNALTEYTGARPRTKEFLLGWPALALFIYLFSKRKSEVLTWVLASISSIVFASVTNTFCHVFADVTLSITRTIGGLIFSLPICLLILWVCSKLINKKEETQ